GARFQLSSCKGKTRIRSNEGGYLVVTMGLADYLEGECLDHTMRSACETCEEWYPLGFSEEPADDDGALMLVPRGLPRMFVLWDGDWYYATNHLKASFSLTERVRTIEEAALFQFV
ncbi:hypothetical protein BP00DRAFT_301599, partial [Aspergillus indologenus CBS 114.80]